MDMLNSLKHSRAQKRLERSDQLELTRAQKAKTHQAGRDQAGIVGCATAVGLAIPGVLLAPVVAPMISQGFIIGAIGAGAISIYGLAHGSIYQLIEARRELKAAKAKQLEAGI